MHGMLLVCFIASGDWAIWPCAAFCAWSELRAHLMLPLAAAMIDEAGFGRLPFHEFGLGVHGKSSPLAFSISSKSRRR